jgi:hypothetical protein
VTAAIPLCQWEVARENYQSILCMQPAAVIIDRRERGRLAVCQAHLNDPLLYQEVKAQGWRWWPLGSDQQMGGE